MRAVEYDCTNRGTLKTAIPRLVEQLTRVKKTAPYVRRAPRRRVVRIQLPAGAPPGGTRRAIHSTLSSRLGPPQGREGQQCAQGRRSESGDGGADHRPEAARHARGDAGDLGREFGRTPMSQGGDGRDRRIEGFSFLVAGAMKAGISYGTTDELGYAAEENPVSVDDFHATMLHLLGVDHQRLAVKFQGLDVRLTGISGDVVRDIVA